MFSTTFISALAYDPIFHICNINIFTILVPVIGKRELCQVFRKLIASPAALDHCVTVRAHQYYYCFRGIATALLLV